MRILSIFAFACLAAGCDTRSQPDAPAGEQRPAANAQVAPAPEPKTAPAKVAESPRQKEHGEAKVLGTLPDGIGLPEGTRVPDAEVRDLEGKATSFLKAIGDQPTLLIFYRGGWCPYCNFQIRQLTQAHDKFSDRGVALVAVSVDQVDTAKTTAAAYSIPFTVLSDSDLELHKAFRVLNRIDDDRVRELKERGMDVKGSSGRDHQTVAVPGVFLIKDGEIKFAHADQDYRVRPTVPQLLSMLDKAGYPEK